MFRIFRCLGVSHESSAARIIVRQPRFRKKKDRPVPVFASRWRLQGEHNGRGTMTITRLTIMAALMAWMAGTVALGGGAQQKGTGDFRERGAGEGRGGEE